MKKQTRFKTAGRQWRSVFVVAALCACGTFGEAQTVHYGGIQTNIPVTLTTPSNSAVDASGNIFIADTYYNQIVEEVSLGNGSYAQTTLLVSSIPSLGRIALDAAGDIFVSSSSGFIKFVPTGSGHYTSTTIPVTGTISYFIVDPSGNIYATDTTHALVYKFTYAGGSYTQSTVVASGLTQPKGIAFDSTNSALYIADAGTGKVMKAVVSGSTYALSSLFTGFSTLTDVATDGKGDIGFLSSGNIFYSILSGTPLALNGSLQQSNGVSFDASGSFYIAQISGGKGSLFKQTPALTPNFGSVALNTTSSTQSLVYVFDTAGSLYSTPFSVVTKGILGLDYNAGGTQGCKTGVSYLATAACTVSVAFTPTQPRGRSGAVDLYGSARNIIATTYLQGVGSGPQLALPPITISTAAIGFAQLSGIAVREDGFLFATDETNNAAYYVVPGSTTAYSFGSGFTSPYGLAIDGAGNVFIASYGSGAPIVKEQFSPVTNSYSQSVAFTGTFYNSPFFDGAGNFYILKTLFSAILYKEIYNGSSYTEVAVNIPNCCIGAATADYFGNLYVADNNPPSGAFGSAGDGNIYKLTPNGTGFTSTLVSSDPNLSANSLAVDINGNVYEADNNEKAINVFTLTNGSYVKTQLALGTQSGSVALDGLGNIFITDTKNEVILKLASSAVAPPLAFPNTADGGTSAPLTQVIENVGDAPLTFAVPSTGANPNTAQNFVLETNSDTTCPVINAGGTVASLAANSQCVLSYRFTPGQLGTLSSLSVLTDNNYGVANSTQVIELTGQGTAGTGTAQTITFPQPTVTTYPGTATLAASASSGLAVTYSVISGPATVSGSSLTYTGPGTVIVQAAQGGNGTYSPAQPVQDTVTVSLTSSLLNWQPSALKIFTGAALTASILDATDTIPGTINYTAALQTSGFPSTVTAVSVLGAGSYNLNAYFMPTDSTHFGMSDITLPFTVQNMNVFVANKVGSVTSLFNNATLQTTAVSGGGLGAAVDASGYVWSINANGSGVSRFNDAGVLSAAYSAGGIGGATALAVDGAGTVWIADGGTLGISSLTNGGATLNTVPIAANLVNAPASISVDPAGSLWLSNPASNTVVEVIGVAAPVTTPTAQSVVNNTLGAKP